MKKSLFFSLLVAIFAISLTACSSKQDKLKSVSDEVTEKMCPMPISQGLELTSMEYTGDDLVITYTFDENVMGADVIANICESKEAIAEQSKQTMRSNAALKPVIDLCKETNSTIVMKMVGKPSDAKCEIEIPASEL